MVCDRIDIRARVNYFSHNSEHRYRLRNPCATGYASKVNIMHSSSPISPSPSLPPFLFFSRLSRAIFERDKGRICREAKLDKTLHPPSPQRRRLAELSECYKRVRARAIRQRCNAVPRIPLSPRWISCFVNFVSSIRPARGRKFKGDVSIVNTLIPRLSDHRCAALVYFYSIPHEIY